MTTQVFNAFDAAVGNARPFAADYDGTYWRSQVVTTFMVNGTPTEISSAAPLPVTGSTSLSGALPAGSNLIGGTQLVDSAGTNKVSISSEGALAIAGSVKATIATLAYSLSGTASVGTTSGTLAAAGSVTTSLTIATEPSSTTNIWLNPTGGAAVVGSGILVNAGGGSFTFGANGAPIPTAAITAITDGSAAQSVALAGG